MNVFSERLRNERKLRGLSQRELADLLGISQSTYKGFELIGEANGREPSIEMIVKIAKLLDIETDYLFGIKD